MTLLIKESESEPQLTIEQMQVLRLVLGVTAALSGVFIAGLGTTTTVHSGYLKGIVTGS